MARCYRSDLQATCSISVIQYAAPPSLTACESRSSMRCATPSMPGARVEIRAAATSRSSTAAGSIEVLRGIDLVDRRRRDGGGGRLFGRRQVDVPARARHARSADARAPSSTTATTSPACRRRAGRLSQPHDRLRLPVPPPAARVHRRRELRHAGADRRACRAPRRSRARAQAARSRGPRRTG